MSNQAQVNQNFAATTFSALIFGAEPAITQPVALTPGFAYQPGFLNEIGIIINPASPYPVGSKVLFDSTDVNQKFWGVTYDNWLNLNDFIASQNPFTFTGDISEARGNAGQTYTYSFTATSATSTAITNTSIDATTIPLGTLVVGSGIPADTVVTAIVSAAAFTISNAATSTVTNLTLTLTTSGIVVGNIPGSDGSTPVLATSVITGITSTAGLVVGALVTGTDIPANSTILEILSSTAILIANNVTATTGGLTITSYLTGASNLLVNVATTQNSTTQWRYDYFVGANGTTVDIDALIAGGAAELLTLPNGAPGIQVVTFNFL